jgi:hypothetical protein
MTKPETTGHEFDKVVELNEAAKQLLARSFHVNLLALDAMVQSKRGQSSVPGFDAVASQMLGWSRELQALLVKLGQASSIVVSRTSWTAKDAHTLGLLRAAAEQSQSALGRAVCERLQAECATSVLSLRQDWRHVTSLLSELSQLGMMACVLSRSAMIEACSAGPELRRQLSDVSREFNAHAEAVVDILSALVRAMNRG